MEFLFNLNLQLFAAGTVVNATTSYVNSDTGATEAFEGVNTLSPTMKTYYDTELLENARSELIFAQFGKRQPLPANKGRTVEWRKWNTLPNANVLQEGVIPTGEKLGMTTLTASLEQYGMFVAITDILDLHAIDNVLLGATEELGASAGETKDILIRDVLMTGTNVMFADLVMPSQSNPFDTDTSPANEFKDMYQNNNRLTPQVVNKAVTALKKAKAPKINGKYIGIIHPSVAYDLRQSDEWIEAHKYAATTEIFNGEIGELHGVRFVETTNAPVINEAIGGEDSSVATTSTDVFRSNVYVSFFLGKDAYGIIDPAGGSMEMIVKDKSQVGGPLEQYSTAGYKFEDSTKILYPERMIAVYSCSEYSGIDSSNFGEK